MVHHKCYSYPNIALSETLNVKFHDNQTSNILRTLDGNQVRPSIHLLTFTHIYVHLGTNIKTGNARVKKIVTK